MCLMIKGAGGLDKLEQLQYHDDEQVHTSALRLIDTYFSDVCLLLVFLTVVTVSSFVYFSTNEVNKAVYPLSSCV